MKKNYRERFHDKVFRSRFQSSVAEEKVKHNGGDNYSLQLSDDNDVIEYGDSVHTKDRSDGKDSISIFMNGGICALKPELKDGSSYCPDTNYCFIHCDFLGETRSNINLSNDYILGCLNRNFVKINTGWFSSIYVSHNALVCLKDLGMPLNSKNDWKEAYEKKDQVLKHFMILKAQEEDEKKEIQTHNEKVELDYLTKKFGADEANKIREGKIWQGMTKDMLLHSKDSYHHPGGEPGDIEETIYKTKTKANYFYDSYTTSHNNIKYKLRITLENDIVVGWKDLD
jgi:hypothetical protein